MAVQIDQEKCTGCGLCVDVCPLQAISIENDKAKVDTTLFLEDVDILDGTPLLDIKPYTAKFDCIATTRNGWQDAVDAKTAKKRGKRGYSRA